MTSTQQMDVDVIMEDISTNESFVERTQKNWIVLNEQTNIVEPMNFSFLSWEDERVKNILQWPKREEEVVHEDGSREVIYYNSQGQPTSQKEHFGKYKSSNEISWTFYEKEEEKDYEPEPSQKRPRA